MFSSARNFCTLFLALAFVFQTGCNPPQISQNPNASGSNTSAENSQRDGQIHPASQPGLSINVASFNIRQFGKTKISRPVVTSILVDIVKKFDIVAVQELRDADQQVIPQFLEMINAQGARYAAAVGPRQGYKTPGEEPTYFEQTVFIYDTNTIQLLGQPYAAYDPTQAMHRPPFVGHFQCIGNTPQEPFSFVLMNVHVAPKNVTPELQALEQIIPQIRQNHSGEDDFILLGDLNAEINQFAQYSWMNAPTAAIAPHMKTTTTLKRSIDNIVYDRNETREFIRSDVLNLMEQYGLSTSDAELVSDHMPVWASFATIESSSASITQGPQGVRR